MRRFVVVVLASFAFAPVAHAAGPCGVTTTATTGAAPLTVTFTATCASPAYTWDFGDGQTATGQSVEHTFAAGAWRPQLTSDAGLDTTAPVTAISLALHAPARARYGQWVTLHASVTPRVPVTLRGRSFVGGKLRVRVLGTAPYIAAALGVSSQPAHILVAPKLVVRVVGTAVVGSRVRVSATLHPASAGSVAGPQAVSTTSPHVAHLSFRSRPAAGWASVRATTSVTVVAPDLSLGAQGPSVRALEERLAALHYAIEQNGVFGDDAVEAVYAFQKVEGLPRTGVVTASVWQRLLHAQIPVARYPGNHIEIDKTRQVLFVVRGGKVALVVATSTGATGNTPLGEWHVYRKVVGYDWVLYYPNYFLRGFAVHGYPDVPPYPASHGCARIPMWVAQTVYGDIALGSIVDVYT